MCGIVASASKNNIAKYKVNAMVNSLGHRGLRNFLIKIYN